MPPIAGPGRRPGRSAYGICPDCRQTRHLLKDGTMGRHSLIGPGGQRLRAKCTGQGEEPLARVAPPEGIGYLYRKAAK
jgi:hypothetical protein